MLVLKPAYEWNVAAEGDSEEAQTVVPASPATPEARTVVGARAGVLVFRGGCIEEAILAAVEGVAGTRSTPVGWMRSGELEVAVGEERSELGRQPAVGEETDLGVLPGHAEVERGPEAGQDPAVGSRASAFEEWEQAFFDGYEPEVPMTYEEMLELVSPGKAARYRVRMRRAERARGPLAALFGFLLG